LTRGVAGRFGATVGDQLAHRATRVSGRGGGGADGLVLQGQISSRPAALVEGADLGRALIGQLRRPKIDLALCGFPSSLLVKIAVLG